MKAVACACAVGARSSDGFKEGLFSNKKGECLKPDRAKAAIKPASCSNLTEGGSGLERDQRASVCRTGRPGDQPRLSFSGASMPASRKIIRSALRHVSLAPDAEHQACVAVPGFARCS
jgi:hypothetical protein